MGSIGEKRTPMAWQHRDMNYHQGGGYQDRYIPSIDYPGGKPGPPSSSDRLSHRTDKSWRTRESQPPYRGGMTPATGSGYPKASAGEQYSPSRKSYSSGRPTSRLQSPDSSSASTSSSEDETEPEGGQLGRGAPLTLQPQSLYGYTGYPGFPGGPPHPGPPFPPPMVNGYPGTMKSSKSVPALTMATWNGEPCPVHGDNTPFPVPGPLIMGPPPMMGPMGPVSLPPPPPPLAHRRAASIYDMRTGGPIYGSLPHRAQGIPGDRRSLVSGIPPPGALQGIPPQFLPPMARPRPMVVSEDGTAEPLPVRSPPEKNGSISGLLAKMASEEGLKKKRGRTKGASCVVWIIITVISLGIILGLLLAFIL